MNLKNKETPMIRVMWTTQMIPRKEPQTVNPFYKMINLLEIGDDHIDDTGAGMEGVRDLNSGERKGYAELKSEILAMLDTLEGHITDNI